VSPRAIGSLVAIGAGVAVVAVIVISANKKALLESVDPTSRDNLAYKGANSVGAALTGDEHFSVGVGAWNMVNAVKGLFGAAEPDLTTPVHLRLVEDAAGNAWWSGVEPESKKGLLSWWPF